jgi:hypothetical protein
MTTSFADDLLNLATATTAGDQTAISAAAEAILSPSVPSPSGAFNGYAPPAIDSGIQGQSFDLADGSVDGDAIAPGSIGGGPEMDSVPPAVPTGLVLTSDVVVATAGLMPEVIATLAQPADMDLVGCWVEFTYALSGGVPDWTNPTRGFIGRESTTFALLNVLPVTTYYGRAKAVDIAGNFSAYTGVVSVTTSVDTVAPETPGMLVAIPGFRALGCAWDFAIDVDLDHYELQYAPEDPADPGNPNTGAWSLVTCGKGTTQRITDLDTTILWFVQVRAVDTSGNASAWSAAVSGTPTLVDYTDVSAAQAVIDLLHTGLLTADAIRSGKVTIKASGAATAIEVRDADDPVLPLGSWDTAGIYIRDADPNLRSIRFMRLDAASLKLYKDGVTPLTAITPDGIDAAAMNFGKGLSGAANVVQNSSVELSPPLALTLLTKTTKAEWDAAETAVDNCTHTVGGSLTVTAW